MQAGFALLKSAQFSVLTFRHHLKYFDIRFIYFRHYYLILKF